MDLMNWVCKPYLDKFVIVFIDDILIYSKSKEDHELEEVRFLRHVVNNNDIHVDSSKIDAMKNWKVPKTPSEIRSFLALAGKRRWIELFSNYDCEIRYHLGKANVVADAFSRKGRVKPRRVRAISMTIRSSVTDKILAAQGEASKVGNATAEMLRGLDQQMKKKEDGGLYFIDRGWDSIDRRCEDNNYGHDSCIKHEIPEWKWGRNTMDFITKLPRSSSGNDTIWIYFAVFVDVAKALGTRLDMSMAYHPQTDGQSEQTIQTLEDMLRACGINFGSSWDTHLPLAEFS
ncbi:putative reverse transcriptase domain-containing protein [Tanacetum coccineum]